METLAKKRALVTGGSRGLGRGVVEALVAHGAEVTAVARNAAHLAELKASTGVAVIAGDAADPDFAMSVLSRVRPSVLVLNAGVTPTMAPLQRQTWESFSAVWNTDVKACFHWVQAALDLPLAPGSRVLLGSSGAAITGSPLSGGYAGAKRTIWLMAAYARSAAEELGLGIRFQALLPRQINGGTELGRVAADAYARRKGVSTEAFLAGLGKPFSLRGYGEYVVSVLTRPEYEAPTAFTLHGEQGIQPIGT